MLTDKYRRITLESPDAPGASTDAAVAALNRRFNPDDFYVVHTGDGIEVWLRQMNLGDLSAAVAEVTAEHAGSVAAMEQVYQAVAGIRSYGVNGYKRLYVGYNSERKVVGRKQKELRRGKHYYANDHGFSKIANPLPPDFEDRIICGDSGEILKRLPDNCIDLVFTSPP